MSQKFKVYSMRMLKRVLKNPIYFLYKFFVGPFITKKYVNLLSKNTEPLELENRLNELLQYAVSQFPRYKGIKIDKALSAAENLKKFPLISRVDLQFSKQQGLSRSFVVAIEANTSGSSGDPLFFYRTAVAGAIDTAHQIHSLKRMGFKSGDRVICFNGFEPSAYMLKKNKFWKRKALIGEGGFGSVQFSTNALNKDTFKYYLAEINRIKPSIIKGYPSAIYIFFKLLQEQEQELSFKLKAVHLTSENIYQYQINYIEKIADCSVYKQFGHTECAMFAETNADSDVYKFSPHYGFVEILDAEGNHVKEGEVGEVTVTGFNCFKEAFIRYRTNDYARYKGIVDGKQAVNEIAGREQDYFITKCNHSIPITSIISGSHLSINQYVTKWQIRQRKRGELIITTLKREHIPDECYKEITALFEPYAMILFKQSEEIKLSPSGKFKFFISEMS